MSVFNITNYFFRDSSFELSREKVEGSFFGVLKRYIKKEEKNKVSIARNQSDKKNVFILLANNHTAFFESIPKGIKEKSIVLKVKSVKGSYELINSYYKLEWVILVKLLGLVAALMNLFNLKQLKNIERNFVQYFLLFGATKSIVRNINPTRIVLFKAENFQARAITRSARLAGVHTVAIQHGLIPKASTQFEQLMVDEYFVWGDSFAKRLNESNAGCKVKIAGNLKTDYLFAQKAKMKPLEGRERILALPNSGDSHTPIQDVKLLIEGLVYAALKMPDKDFFIKPHPADVNNNVENILKSCVLPTNLIFIKKESFIKLGEYSLLVINNSASGLEAAIFEVPQIVVSSKEENIMVPQYISYQSAVWASSIISIEQRIVEIFLDINRFKQNCKMLTNDFISYQGEAAQRISELLEC